MPSVSGHLEKRDNESSLKSSVANTPPIIMASRAGDQESQLARGDFGTLTGLRPIGERLWSKNEYRQAFSGSSERKWKAIPINKANKTAGPP